MDGLSVKLTLMNIESKDIDSIWMQEISLATPIKCIPSIIYKLIGLDSHIMLFVTYIYSST